MSFESFKFGFLLSMGLVVALGAQNLCLLRMALTTPRVAYKGALIFFMCDVFLVFLGAFGVGHLLSGFPILSKVLIIGGALFLIVYGSYSVRAYFVVEGPTTQSNTNLEPVPVNHWPLKEGLGFSLLNPHALIDTLILIGGATLTLSGVSEKLSFLAGVLVASLLWFSGFTTLVVTLGRKVINPLLWRWLSLVTGVLMFYIAFKMSWPLLG